MVVVTNNIYAVIRAEIGTTDGQVVCLEIHSKIEHDMELGGVDQDQVMDCGVDG